MIQSYYNQTRLNEPDRVLPIDTAGESIEDVAELVWTKMKLMIDNTLTLKDVAIVNDAASSACPF